MGWITRPVDTTGSCNIAAYVPALAGQYVSPDGTSLENITATPILDEIELVMNEFTKEDLIDFQLQYNLNYVEELFGALEDPASGGCNLYRWA